MTASTTTANTDHLNDRFARYNGSSRDELVYMVLALQDALDATKTLLAEARAENAKLEVIHA